MAVPRHRTEIRRERLYAEVTIFVDGRVVLETTADRDISREAAETYARQYFHLPLPRPKKQSASSCDESTHTHKPTKGGL